MFEFASPSLTFANICEQTATKVSLGDEEPNRRRRRKQSSGVAPGVGGSGDGAGGRTRRARARKLLAEERRWSRGVGGGVAGAREARVASARGWI